MMSGRRVVVPESGGAPIGGSLFRNGQGRETNARLDAGVQGLRDAGRTGGWVVWRRAIVLRRERSCGRRRDAGGEHASGSSAVA